MYKYIEYSLFQNFIILLLPETMKSFFSHLGLCSICKYFLTNNSDIYENFFFSFQEPSWWHFLAAASTAFIMEPRIPLCSNWSTAVMVEPPGEQTSSFNMAGWFPVFKTIWPAPTYKKGKKNSWKSKFNEICFFFVKSIFRSFFKTNYVP